MGKRGGLVDRKLLPRIEEYVSEKLESEEAPSTIGTTEIVASLRAMYGEYGRLPFAPFSKTVSLMIERLQEKSDQLNSILLTTEQEVSLMEDLVEESSANSTVPDQSKPPNMLNSSLRNVYKPKTSEESMDSRKRKSTASLASAKKRPASAPESSSFSVERPSTTYGDVGGMERELQEIRELVEPALLHPEIYAHLGVSAPSGLLLHGPPGCGKTLLVHAIAGELGVNFLKVAAPEIVSGMSGESEAKVRLLFEEAMKSAPCLLFLDEIDAITPKRENAGKEMERRIVAQLLNSMDELTASNAAVVVIGATNRPDSLDSALRRSGRFEREVLIGIPDEAGRSRIFQKLAGKMRLEGEFDFNRIARLTPGYVGADLASLTKEAASIAVRRVYQSLLCDQNEVLHRNEVSDKLKGIKGPLDPELLANLCVRMEDFEEALKVIQPSSKREGFAMIPDVSWEDIGALDVLRKQLHMSVVLPITSPELFRSVGLTSPAGVLLFGPPGCGKTLVAKAIANESRAAFISVKGPELLNKFVGESERSVRLVFQRARASAPCVIFFDELDALCPRRGSGAERSDSVTERVVNQLLTEMDGLDSRKQVFVIAATNRPDIIDPAMLRPGRLDKILYVPLPSGEGRLSILRTLVRKSPLSSDVDLALLSSQDKLVGFSGADLASLVREASIRALEEAIPDIHMLDGSKEPIKSESSVEIRMSHFLDALESIHPSVSEAQQKRYDKMQKMLCRSRAVSSIKADDSIQQDQPLEESS